MEEFLKEIGREIYESEKKNKNEEEIRKKYEEIVKKYDLDFETARALIAYYFTTADKWLKIAAELSPVVTLINVQIRKIIERQLEEALHLHREAEGIISEMLKKISSNASDNKYYLVYKGGVYKDRERMIKILRKEIEALEGFGAQIVDRGWIVG